MTRSTPCALVCLTADEFPARALERFGPPGRLWIGEMITAVINNSLDSGDVSMDPATLEVMHELREFMFKHVYFSESQLMHTDSAIAVIRRLVDYYLDHPAELTDSYRDPDADLVTQVVDHVAGMTDRYALQVHERLFGLA